MIAAREILQEKEHSLGLVGSSSKAFYYLGSDFKCLGGSFMDKSGTFKILKLAKSTLFF